MKTDLSRAKEYRKFAFTVGGLFIGLLGLVLPLLFSAKIPLWPHVVGAILILWGAVSPATLGPVHAAWMKLGELLHAMNSRLILGVMFFAIFTPIAAWFRLRGRDPLVRKLDVGARSYRKTNPRDPVERMERPY